MALLDLSRFADLLTGNPETARAQLLDAAGDIQRRMGEMGIEGELHQEIGTVREEIRALGTGSVAAAPDLPLLYPDIAQEKTEPRIPLELILAVDRLQAALLFREKMGHIFSGEEKEIGLEVLKGQLQYLHLEELSPGVLQLTFDHGNVNEMGRVQLREFEKFILWANQQKTYQVLVIHSNKLGKDGLPIFQGGADFMERKRERWSGEEKDLHVRWQRRLMAQFQSIPLITIAVAHGKAMGWGAEFLGLTNINIGTPELQVSLPEASLGIIPGAGGSGGIRGLEAKIGRGDLEMLVSSGKILRGEELRGTLVQEVLAGKDAAYTRALEIVREIMRRSPSALRLGKLSRLLSQELGSAGREFLEQAFYRNSLTSGDSNIGAENAREFRSGEWPNETSGWNPPII